VLAHHYLHALELVRAAGPAADVEELEEQARRYLALAGERALVLDVASAEASLAKALELAPTGHSARPSLLERWARAAQQQYRLQEAEEALEEAVAIYRERGETVAAGRVLSALSIVLSRLGRERAEEAITQAITLLEARPHGPELVAAYTELAGFHAVQSAHADAIAAADRAAHNARSCTSRESRGCDQLASRASGECSGSECISQCGLGPCTAPATTDTRTVAATTRQVRIVVKPFAFRPTR
jgi:tetratricopeptide (TPR) repeat protein